MKISYNWLSEYVSHGLSIAELADALTLSGLEVEHIEQHDLSLDGVLVGQVRSVRPHPDADRLQLCDVDLGDGTPVQIVCGAPNVAPDQRVPVATAGSRLTINEKTIMIKKTKIRGQVSMGMICAEDELGISEDHRGIMILTGSSTIGEPLKEYLLRERGLAADTTLDLAITPNRPDAVCHFGVARDLSALQNVQVTFPDVPIPPSGSEAANHIDISIQCPDVCSRYTAMIVRNVTVGSSPVWLKQRLEAVGLRSINNIVDVTNFVMYECGQPLHAFDYDRIAQKKIIVRESVEGETFVTLDSRQHTLEEGVVLICDAKEPVAIGGIMGGQNSEVGSTTTNILIESAWFDPTRTRRSSKILGISTDASYRFERGVDPRRQPWAAMRTAMLIAELAGGRIVQGMVDVYPTPKPLAAVDLRISRIRTILGIEIEHRRILQILESLGFAPREAAEGLVSCTIPTYRPDVNLEIDLIEEVARIHGLENIDLPEHTSLRLSAPRPRPADLLREHAYIHLTGHGFREIYTNSLLPDEVARQFSQAVLDSDDPPARTLNAVSRSMATLRPSLLPGMLMAMQHNANHSQRVLRFYEFGHVFHHSKRAAAFIENFSEYDVLLVGISGAIRPANWDQDLRVADFFDLKGEICQLLDALQFNALRMQPSYTSTELTDYHITLYSGRTHIGILAKLSGAIQESFDLPDPVFFAEFNWTRLLLLHEKNPSQTYTRISPFPEMERDLSVSVDKSQAVGPMISTLRKVGQPLLRNVDVFDVYTGNQIPADKKSIAFSLRFGGNRTLRDEEIDRIISAIVNAFSEQFGATLRS